MLIENLLWVDGWDDTDGVDPFYLTIVMYLKNSSRNQRRAIHYG